MANTDKIEAILGKGAELSAEDVREIEVELAGLPLDDAHEAEPWVWEAVALIVDDPEYQGTARLPEAV